MLEQREPCLLPRLLFDLWPLLQESRVPTFPAAFSGSSVDLVMLDFRLSTPLLGPVYLPEEKPERVRVAFRTL